ncbi:hypothetical protein [Nocardia sp. NPDC052112]|uniref:hypothetical protein n=1 Tax=Nocardia sp. NPDC052112 TaxID=3155646 RepID=UPI003436056C
MREIFPTDPDGPEKLARYYVKNIGCRIAEVGFEVPAELIDFMDGAPTMPHVNMTLFHDYSVHDQFTRAGIEPHFPVANKDFRPENPNDGSLLYFTAEVQDGPVGVLFGWFVNAADLGANFWNKPVVPLFDRRHLPFPELHQDQWNAAEGFKIMNDQQGRE